MPVGAYKLMSSGLDFRLPLSQIEKYEAAPTLAIVERLAEAFEIDPPLLVTEIEDVLREFRQA